MFNPVTEYITTPQEIPLEHFHKYKEAYVVRPPYQRKNVWSDAKQKALLDSLFRQYYIPKIVLREVRLNSSTTFREVIDGQQRIITAQRFYSGELKLPRTLKDLDKALLGVKHLPIRVFVDPDLDVLLETNTKAGTTLRQIAFDKSVQRSLGSALFQERIDKYRQNLNLPPDDESFSEKDIVDHFRGEWRVIKKYVLDAVRNSITHHPDNLLKDYIEFGGKAKEKPISYSSIEKTFYSHFIYGDILETPLNYGMEEGTNPRELEKEQILRLMNIIAERIYIGKYDPSIGSARIESNVQKNEDIDDAHVRAHRMGREEILYNWLKFIRQIVHNFYIMQGAPVDEKKLFQYRFPDQLWKNIEHFIINLTKLPVWVNRELSTTVFGGKQNLDFWQHIFETGRTPSGHQVLSEKINLMKMIGE